jgi:hypothetical protein
METTIDVSFSPKKYMEIFDLIAQLLDYETDKEFIERTYALAIRKKIPETHKSEYPIKKNVTRYHTEHVAYSPDNATYAESNKSYDKPSYDLVQKQTEPSKNLIIIDRKTNEKREYCLGDFHQKLAISNGGQLFATIYTSYNADPLNGFVQQNSLSITNSSTEKKEYYHLPKSCKSSDDYPSIAFNKQSTKIIVHTIGEIQHIIFPLTITSPDMNNDNKKTFAKYCAQRGICKNLIPLPQNQ